MCVVRPRSISHLFLAALGSIAVAAGHRPAAASENAALHMIFPNLSVSDSVAYVSIHELVRAEKVEAYYGTNKKDSENFVTKQRYCLLTRAGVRRVRARQEENERAVNDSSLGWLPLTGGFPVPFLDGCPGTIPWIRRRRLMRPAKRWKRG